MMQPKSRSMPVKPIGVGNISLRSLVRTDAAELRRIVRGLGNTVNLFPYVSSKSVGCVNLPEEAGCVIAQPSLHLLVDHFGWQVRTLNDYLMELLVERDELLGRQDDMLEEISELTDKML